MLPQSIIKVGFYLLYYQLAWSYDLVAWLVSFGQWAAWRRLCLAYLQPGPILELAYGTGGLFVDLLHAGHRPVGLDLSPYMARIARQRLARHHFDSPLCRAQAQQIPFSARQFANIVATFPSDYILQPETLDEISRVLQPHGRLIIVLEGELKGPALLRHFVAWLYKITGQREEYSYPTPNSLLNQTDQQAKFSARWQMARHHGVAARLLIAEKA